MVKLMVLLYGYYPGNLSIATAARNLKGLSSLATFGAFPAVRGLLDVSDTVI